MTKWKHKDRVFQNSVVRTTFCDLLSTSLQNRTTKSESCNGTNTKCKTLQNQKSMDHSFRYRNTLGAVFVLLFLFSIVHYLELFVFLLLSLIIFSSYLSKKKKRYSNTLPSLHIEKAAQPSHSD